MNRLLSKKEKPEGTHRRDKSREKSRDRENTKATDKAGEKTNGEKAPAKSTNKSIASIFTKRDPPDSQKQADRDLRDKISSIEARLKDVGCTGANEEIISQTLETKAIEGDVDKAFDQILLSQESLDGQIKPYNPDTHMLGAENRESVTCYLDTVLFAMFARLKSFEPLLCTDFDDERKGRLQAVIRLWVNMLRTGKLITPNITKNLQDALAAAGWGAAALVEQQDACEAFSWITDILDMPLLKLTLDVYHGGIDADPDDHKEVQERMLDVAIPEDYAPHSALTLEYCLENHFSNKISVQRKVPRFDASKSATSAPSELTETETETAAEPEQEPEQELEQVHSSWSDTPTQWPGESSTAAHEPISPTSPSSRHRGFSIIRRSTTGVNEPDSHSNEEVETDTPAWQIMNLIPWDKKDQPFQTYDEVAKHFAESRPLLCIGLKRYTVENSVAKKNDTYVDIGLEMKLPHFVEDERRTENGQVVDNFELSLQSFICHRGNSADSGHYIAFVRVAIQPADGDIRSKRKQSDSEQPPQYPEDRWIKFDDLNEPRVEYVDDIQQVLRDEVPYMLFYQAQPRIENLENLLSENPGACQVQMGVEDSSAAFPGEEPPAYSNNEPHSFADSGIAMKISSPTDGATPDDLDGAGHTKIRFSSDLERPGRETSPRRNMNLGDDTLDDRRGSIAMTEASLASTTSGGGADTETRASRGMHRWTNSGSKSRPTSTHSKHRMSSSINSITRISMSWKASKEQLNKVEASKTPGTEMNGQIDGPPGSSRNSMTIEDPGLKPEDGMLVGDMGKRGRKRDKSQEPSATEPRNQLRKKNGKGEERVCALM